ncbi:h domain protein [Nocardia stercoris]|uniref:H domain protein n=1 Tax=Nocardia stercoris TaxID=2483361 RepID=A0A3M2KUJ0_9NOCA|nr:h domain protein [Nocardia stercoris]
MILTTTAAVLVVVAAVCGGLVWWKHHEDSQLASARKDSLTAARKTVEAMFTYDFHTVDTELPKAGDGMTASFRSDYKKLVDGAIAPGAKEKQLTVQATSQAAGIISADNNRAVVLLYLNQVTTSKDNPQNTVTPSRVRVNLDHDNGRWLVAGVTPI